MNKEVAERIRLLRLSKNLSQENMADELSISIGAYSNIERGITELTLTRVTEIAAILDVDVIELLNQATRQNKANEAANLYGYALQKDLEELRIQVLFLQKEIKKLAAKK